MHLSSNPDSAARDALERWIASQLPACSHDELRIIGVRLERLTRARSNYGELHIATDRRDFRREAAEENVDRMFYLDCLLIARQDEARERLHCEAADEIAHANPVEHGLRELAGAHVQVAGFIGTPGVDLEVPPAEPTTAPRVRIDFEMIDERFDDGGDGG